MQIPAVFVIFEKRCGLMHGGYGSESEDKSFIYLGSNLFAIFVTCIWWCHCKNSNKPSLMFLNLLIFVKEIG